MFNSSLSNKRKKIGSVGNLSFLSESLPNLNTSQLPRSQSLFSLKDTSLANCSDWPMEKSKIDNAMIEKGFVVYKKLESSSHELVINKLILECLRNIASNADKKLTQSTAKKLNTIIEKWDIEKYLNLEFNGEESNLKLLGISNIPDAELSQMEKIRIKSCLEAKLQERVDNIVDIYREQGVKVEEEIKSAENVRERYMDWCGFEKHSLTEKMIELLKNYQESIQIFYEKLHNLKNLKSDAKNSQLKKSANLDLQIKVLALKTKIDELICIKKLYTETPHTIEAFRKLNTLLDDNLDFIEKEIQQKKELKKQFKALEGTEFDTIVKKYKEFCLMVDKQKKMLETL